MPGDAINLIYYLMVERKYFVTLFSMTMHENQNWQWISSNFLPRNSVNFRQTGYNYFP